MHPLYSCSNVVSNTVLLLLILYPSSSNGLISLSDVGDIVRFSHEVATDVFKAWNLVNPARKDPQYIDIPFLKDREKKLMTKIGEVTRRIDIVDKHLEAVSLATKINLNQDIPKQLRFEMRLDSLFEQVAMIEIADNTFRDYSEIWNKSDDAEQLERHTLENFATYVVSHNPDSVQSVLDRIHQIISPDRDSVFVHSSIYAQVRHALQEAEGNLCHVEQSAQQILYNLYNRLQVIQLKGYTMMQFSWMLLRLYKKGNFTLESQMMQNKHIERMSEQVRSIKETLTLADTSYWRCDPKHQVEEETYTQITRLVQGYIQNEVDLNSKESCMENCGYYAVSKQHGCFGGQFCGKQRGCAGAIYDCQYIDSDMWVCQSDMRKTNRRYDWIEYENGRILGNKGSCARQSKVDSWWRWLFWHCSYCFCMCDDPTNSDRYFNLRVTASDTANNKVVTGLRFIKQDRIIHLQIQEGTLLPFGNINQSSITWRPVDQYTTADARDGVDYFTLSYSQRAFDLDDLKLSNNQVVTGVRFRKVGTHLNLEVRGTRFNFTNGKLILPGRGDEWISNDNTDGAPISPRKQLVIEQPDNPLHSLAPSQIYSSSNQYLLFTHSDIDLDAAQTTVPFIDTQIVAPQPAVPLSGIGVHYKGRRWFGGYIAPKVFTYDYSTHIKEQFVDMKNNDSLNAIN